MNKINLKYYCKICKNIICSITALYGSKLCSTCCRLGERNSNWKGIVNKCIDYDKTNCNEKNLISLCGLCNRKANYNRDYWFAYYSYIIEEIYGT